MVYSCLQMKIKYDKIGTGYNSTRNADPYLIERILHHLQPESNKTYLDIGCGTGNYTIALAEKGYRFTGLEPSGKMLAIARARNQTIEWLQGTAEHIAAADESFEGIIATLTIHHWTDLKKAFGEISRVLSHRGRFVLFTSTPQQMQGYWLNHYFPKMMQDSINQMPSLAVIQKAVAKTDLIMQKPEIYALRDDLQDGFLYIGKNNPNLYFRESIQNGISSFSSLANEAEVIQGLSQLRKDIDNRMFESIRNEYENKLGDYLFIPFVKAGAI